MDFPSTVTEQKEEIRQKRRKQSSEASRRYYWKKRMLAIPVALSILLAIPVASPTFEHREKRLSAKAASASYRKRRKLLLLAGAATTAGGGRVALPLPSTDVLLGEHCSAVRSPLLVPSVFDTAEDLQEGVNPRDPKLRKQQEVWRETQTKICVAAKV
jgi:hypothetical protein